MIIMGLEFTGKAPFNTVYLHGLVSAGGRAGTGRAQPLLVCRAACHPACVVPMA